MVDHSRVPVLEALRKFRRRGDVVYGPPGHKQGRGADPRVVEIVGAGVFASDVLSLNGLDDRRQSQARLPELRALELDSLMLPRVAFFGPVEQVPVEQAAGRIAAGMVSPYPPGVPVLVPGEKINQAVLDHLTTGVRAGMLIPDAADPTMKSIRVVARR